MKHFVKTAIILLVVAFSLSASVDLFAQETKAHEQNTPLRKEIVRLKYLSGMDAMMLLQPFMSREGRIMPAMQGQELISIVDREEIVIKVLDLVKQFDVKPADMLFTVQLILGEETGEAKIDDILAGDPIIQELKGLMKYRSYALLDSSIIRTIDKKEAYVVFGKDGSIGMRLTPRYVQEGQQELLQLGILLTQFIGDRKATVVSEKETGENRGKPSSPEMTKEIINTNLILKSGERTVVGVSRLEGGDKGLILIISGKVIR